MNDEEYLNDIPAERRLTKKTIIINVSIMLIGIILFSIRLVGLTIPFNQMIHQSVENYENAHLSAVWENNQEYVMVIMANGFERFSLYDKGTELFEHSVSADELYDTEENASSVYGLETAGYQKVSTTGYDILKPLQFFGAFIFLIGVFSFFKAPRRKLSRKEYSEKISKTIEVQQQIEQNTKMSWRMWKK